LLEIFYPGGSQAHSGTLLLYPGLRQAQILHVDSTCKTCGGVTGIAKKKIEIASENPDVPLLKRVEAGYIHTKH